MNDKNRPQNNVGFSIGFIPGQADIRKFAVPSGEECIIRTASPDDAGFIAKGINAGIDDVGNVLSLRTLVLRDGSLYNYRNALIAEIDETPIGCIVSYDGALYRQMYDKTFPDQDFVEQTNRKEYHIDTLYVEPKFRKQGISQELIATAIDEARKKGIAKEVTCVVLPDKPRLTAFYERHGFENRGIRPLAGTNYTLLALNK
ncbi:MAG: GNAT family N-acetyltransferase [Muribaculaceae bacterium]|nr:GNAT family N-acetyltransferase [Muribaculaceae bacterium]